MARPSSGSSLLRGEGKHLPNPICLWWNCSKATPPTPPPATHITPPARRVGRACLHRQRTSRQAGATVPTNGEWGGTGRGPIASSHPSPGDPCPDPRSCSGRRWHAAVPVLCLSTASSHSPAILLSTAAFPESCRQQVSGVTSSQPLPWGKGQQVGSGSWPHQSSLRELTRRFLLSVAQFPSIKVPSECALHMHDGDICILGVWAGCCPPLAWQFSAGAYHRSHLGVQAAASWLARLTRMPAILTPGREPPSRVVSVREPLPASPGRQAAWGGPQPQGLDTRAPPSSPPPQPTSTHSSLVGQAALPLPHGIKSNSPKICLLSWWLLLENCPWHFPDPSFDVRAVVTVSSQRRSHGAHQAPRRVCYDAERIAGHPRAPGPELAWG